MTQVNPVIVSDQEDENYVSSAVTTLRGAIAPLAPAQDLSLPLNSSEDINAQLIAEEIVKLPTPTRNQCLQAKNWFLTYPQCATTKEEALRKLQGHPKLTQLGIKGLMIAQEKHQDGNPHLHIALWLQKTLKTRDRRFYDFVCE